MKSALLIFLAFSQVLIASPRLENFEESGNSKHNPSSKWVGKTCAAAAISLAAFALCTIQASFTPSSSYKPFAAAGMAGAATYLYFELSDDSE